MLPTTKCLPMMPRKAVFVLGACILLLCLGMLALPQRLSTYTRVSSVESGSLPTFASWPYVEVVQDADKSTWPYRVFKSSILTPPNITISVNKGGLAEGYLFLDPKSRGKNHGQKQGGPTIIGMDNELVYYHNTPYGTNNFRVQELEGEPRLTFWHGHSVTGHGYGRVVILDRTYSTTTVSLDANIDSLSNDNSAGLIDFHEQQLTSRGTILVSVYNNTQMDLSAIGGNAKSWACDSLFYEIEVSTGRVLFSWSALDHIPIEASKLPLKSYMGDGSRKSPWDHFHINSIQDLDDGFLISSRHTWACYLVSKATGEILWTLGGDGNASDFAAMQEDGQFRWQHDARVHNITKNGMMLSLFDNHSTREDKGTAPTRGLLLELPMPPNTSQSPKVLRRLEGQGLPYVDSQGSYQTNLQNGNQMLGYGPLSLVREYGPGSDGKDLFWEGRFGHNSKSQSYRAFKGSWRATPASWDPRIALDAEAAECKKAGLDRCVRVHVSWNGATEVEYWNVYVGSRFGLTLVGKAHKRGFETVFDVPTTKYGSCVQIGAVQAMTEVRRSKMTCL